MKKKDKQNYLEDVDWAIYLKEMSSQETSQRMRTKNETN